MDASLWMPLRERHDEAGTAISRQAATAQFCIPDVESAPQWPRPTQVFRVCHGDDLALVIAENREVVCYFGAVVVQAGHAHFCIPDGESAQTFKGSPEECAPNSLWRLRALHVMPASCLPSLTRSGCALVDATRADLAAASLLQSSHSLAAVGVIAHAHLRLAGTAHEE